MKAIEKLRACAQSGDRSDTWERMEFTPEEAKAILADLQSATTGARIYSDLYTKSIDRHEKSESETAKKYNAMARRLEKIKKIHVPVMEDGKPVGCEICDWGTPEGEGWPCETRKTADRKLYGYDESSSEGTKS